MMIAFSGRHIIHCRPINAREVINTPGMVKGLQTPMYLFVCIGHASRKFRYFGKRKPQRNAQQRRALSRLRKADRARDAEMGTF